MILAASRDGAVTIALKPSRAESVAKACRGHLETGVMGLVDSKELAGQIISMRESHFGRCGAQALRELHVHERTIKEGRFNKGMKEALEWLCEYRPTAKPRRLECLGVAASVTVFTDEACE